MPLHTITATFEIKKGSVYPTLDVQVVDKLGAPLNLSAYGRVFFTMVLPVENGADIVKVNAVAGSFIDKPSGKIRYSWAAGDVDTVADYAAEFKLMPASPVDVPVFKVPTDSAIRVRVIEDVEP